MFRGRFCRVVAGWRLPRRRGSAAVCADAARSPPVSATSPEHALVGRYCLGCHNDRTRAQGLSLSSADLLNVAPDAEVWEKVVRKLRARAMPPSGSPRPDEAGYQQLDRAPRDLAGSRRVGQTQSGAHRTLPASESHRVSQRGPRPARARRRRQRPAAGRRCELRVRQRQRHGPVADVDGTLSRRGPEGQPAGRRQPRARAAAPDLRRAARPDAGGADRRPAVRHTRRHFRDPHVPRRRRVRVPRPSGPRPERERRRPARPARDRARARRRAPGALDGHAEPQPLRAVLLRRRRRQAPGVPGKGHRRAAHGVGDLHRENLGAGGDRASALPGQFQRRPHAARAAGRPIDLDRRSFQCDGRERHAEPAPHLHVHAGNAARRKTPARRPSSRPWRDARIDGRSPTRTSTRR